MGQCEHIRTQLLLTRPFWRALLHTFDFGKPSFRVTLNESPTLFGFLFFSTFWEAGGRGLAFWHQRQQNPPFAIFFSNLQTRSMTLLSTRLRFSNTLLHYATNKNNTICERMDATDGWMDAYQQHGQIKNSMVWTLGFWNFFFLLGMNWEYGGG